MKQFALITVLLFCILSLGACDAVLGPPGSEPPDLPQGTAIPYDVLSEGEPGTDIKTMGGLFIWRDGDNWHVRVAGLNIPHVTYPKDVFAGTVRVEDGFVVTNQLMTAMPDEIRVGRDDIFFRFEVEKEVKGIDFRVQPMAAFSYCVNFDVRINSVSNPDWTYIGRTTYSPVPMPLKICVRK